MDLDLRTADLDLHPDLGSPHLAISTGQVAHMADAAQTLRALVGGAPDRAVVAVAAFSSLAAVEPLAFYVGALRATVPDLAGPPLTPAAFQLADPQVLRRLLEGAGLIAVRVQSVTRRVHLGSGRRLLDAVAKCDPTGTERLRELTPGQSADLAHVLDGMLRERSGGARGATLRTVINIGSGRVRTAAT